MMTSAMRLQTETVSRWSRWWLMSKLMGWQATGHPNHEEIAAGDSGETCGHPKPPSCRWGYLSRFFFWGGRWGVCRHFCFKWMYILMFGGLRFLPMLMLLHRRVSALEMLENPERQCKEDFLLYLPKNILLQHFLLFWAFFVWMKR